MQVTETLSDGLKRGYTVVLPAENLDSRRAARLADLGKTLKLPGFRPGKVPLTIVKQRFGTAVAAEVVDESVRDAMETVMAERGLRPARQPKVALVTENPTEPGVNVEFSVEMELLPAITLPDFSGIALTRYKTEVAPEQIEEALGRIGKANRTLEPLSAEELAARPEGDGAVNGDVLTMDYLGKIDGEPFEGGAGTDIEVEIGGEGFIPGFAEQLAGAKPGEARTIAVTFPENYGKTELAGKPATFDITVKQVSRQVIPAINDDLALKLGVDSEAELRDLVRNSQQREYDQISRTRLKKVLLDALTGLVDFPVPPSIVDEEFKQIWDQFEKARTAGTQDEEDKGKDDDTLKAEYRAIAERRVRLGLLLAEIATVNAITVSQQELDRALYARVSQFKGQEMQMFDLFKQYPEMMNTIRGPILEDKVVDFVLELANVTEQVVPPLTLLNDDPSDAVAGEPTAGQAGEAAAEG
jgi:trigger factor